MDAEEISGKQEKVKRKSFVSFRKSFSSMIDSGSTKNKGNDSGENSANQTLEDAPAGRRASAPDAGIASPGDSVSDVAGSDAAGSPKQKKSKRFSLKGVTKLFRSNSLKSTASQEMIDTTLDNVGVAEEDAGFDESRMSEASASTAGVDAAGVPKKKKSKIFSTKSFTKMFRSNSMTSANGTDVPDLGDGASVDENGARPHTMPPKRKSFFSFKKDKDHGDKSSVGTPAAETAARNSANAPVEDAYSGPVSPTFERSATSMDDDEEVTQIDAAQLANSSFFNPSKSSAVGKAVSPPRAQSSSNSASKLFQQVDEPDADVAEEEKPSPKPVKGAAKSPQAALAPAEKKNDESEDTRRESYSSRSGTKDTRGRMGSIREEDIADLETTTESAAKTATASKATASPPAPAASTSTKHVSSPASAAVVSPKQARSPAPASASPKVLSPVRQTKQTTPAVTPQPVPVVQLTIQDSELFSSPEPNQTARTDRSLSMQSEQPLSPLQNAGLDSESGSGKAKKPSTLFKSAAKMIRRSILGSPSGGAAGTPPPPPPPAPEESSTQLGALLTEEDNFRPFGQSSPVKQGERSPHHQPFDGQPSNFRPSSSARSSPVPSHTSSRSPEKFIFEVPSNASRKSPSEVSAANEPPKSVFVIASQAENENLAELRLSLTNGTESELAALLVAPSPNVPVTKLILRNNGIISPERFSFGVRFEHLTDLDLGYNNITGAIKGLPHTLLRLDLSHNRITNVSAVLNCVNLVELNLSHNDIKSFHSLPPKLERLDLAHNSITAAMTLRTLALSPGIKYLDLRCNAVILEVVEWKVVLRTILTHLLELNGRAIPKPKKPITVPAVAASKTESPPKTRTGAAAAREEQRVNDAVRTRMHALKLELLKESQETLGRSMAPKVKSIRPEELEGLSKRLAAPTKALTHKTTAAPLVAPLFSNRDLIQRKSVQHLASTTPRGGDVDLTAWLNKAKQNISKAVKAVIRAVKLSDEEEVEVDDIMSLSAGINRLELFTTRDLPLKIEYAIEKLIDGDVLKRKIATAREQSDLIGQLLQQVDSALLLSAQGAFKLRDAVDSAMNSGPGLIAYTTLLRSFDASFDPSILTARRNSPRQEGLSTLQDNQGSFMDDRSSDRRQQGANSQDDFSYRVKDLADSRNTSPSRVKSAVSARDGYSEGKQTDSATAPGPITPEAFLDRVRSRMTSRAFFGTAAQATYEGSAASQGEPESKTGSSAGAGPAPTTRTAPSATLFAAEEDAPPPPPPSDKKTVAQAAAERVAARVSVSRSQSQRNLESKVESDTLPEIQPSVPVPVALSSSAAVEELPPPPPETSPLSYVSELQTDTQQRDYDGVAAQQELALGASWDASSLVSAPAPAFQAPYHAAEEVLYEPYHQEEPEAPQEELEYNYDEQYQLQDTYQYPEEDQDTYQVQYPQEYQEEYQEEYRGLDADQYEQEQDQRDRDEAEAYRLFLLAAAEEDKANEAAWTDDGTPTVREEVPMQADLYSAPSATAAVLVPAKDRGSLLERGTSEYSLSAPPTAPAVQRSSSEVEGLDASFLVPPEVEPFASAPPAPPAPLAPPPAAAAATVAMDAAEVTGTGTDSGNRSNAESPLPTDDTSDADTSKMSAKDRIKARLAKNKKT